MSFAHARPFRSRLAKIVSKIITIPGRIEVIRENNNLAMCFMMSNRPRRPSGKATGVPLKMPRGAEAQAVYNAASLGCGGRRAESTACRDDSCDEDAAAGLESKLMISMAILVFACGLARTRVRHKESQD